MDRDKNIDNLRGLAMLAMIISHTTAYFLKDKLAFLIWDITEFAVPIFLFCSIYIFYQKLKTIDWSSFLKYLKKRLSRLLLPYYLFLLVYFFLIYFFEPKKLSFHHFFSNIFLYGGLSLNWLVLLFIYLIFLMPFIFLLEERKLWFYLYGAFSLVSSLVFVFISPINYRLIMWLPWSLIIYLTIYVIKNKNNNKRLFLLAAISLTVFALLYFVEKKTGHKLIQYANKYPPNLYHLSYGAFSIVFFFWLSKKKIFQFLSFDKFLKFFSINSYSLFFIHNLVILILNWLNIRFFNWILFFIFVIAISMILQFFLNVAKKLFV
ncbi:hypothetical protein CO048_00305 [Candidatus Roizmanbacteria bacterium CG_4_9_14_0_2_um_filter_35_15]|uniref:Acyltransferase 3 domain-containing protein n=1 Tax=Candidatus Roizmanbacteria bacterium CG_4_9_14_0_2_um_filter_35_15 TaxID=1974836 RepID=A0A2M8F507_9BACT|nr:MAG: hypothetical protein CO048_00305 [Candidatus Roizmanbacteria bacterium CG_4_9_14_0_2_um_filter_35_15]